MIMSRTPFRISLFGGGTDYPTWYREYGGLVVGTTINKYCYISYRHRPRFSEQRDRIVHSRIESPQNFDGVRHPAVRAILDEYQIQDGVEIQSYGELPARSGMGSSSAFTVGLLNVLRAYNREASSAEDLAREAIRMEQQVIREAVGSQDQIWAAYGGTNVIRFHTDGHFDVTPVILTAERRRELQSHLLLFFTRLARNSSVVASRKIQNLKSRRAQLVCMHEIAEQAIVVLQSSSHPTSDIGHLLHESWRLKKELADGVTTGRIDQIYTAATAAGALGGKLLGAGGGGFLLIFAEPHTHSAIREALHDLIEVSFEIGSPGSRIVIHEPNGVSIRSRRGVK